MNEQEQQEQSEKFKHYRKIAIAVFSAISVGLGVYLDVIPIAFITELFGTGL